jgi:uncharacterized LabA/DUF88 family protein
MVTPPAHDVQMAIRQETYIRAIRTLPDAKVHFGHFNTKIVKGSELDASKRPTWRMIEVQTSEEKGSDVNLATYLLLDAFSRSYDAAIVISNDSDLLEPIMRVRQRFGVAVHVANPTRHLSRLLRSNSNSYISLTLADAQACQFADELRGPDGRVVRKPSRW